MDDSDLLVLFADRRSDGSEASGWRLTTLSAWFGYLHRLYQSTEAWYDGRTALSGADRFTYTAFDRYVQCFAPKLLTEPERILMITLFGGRQEMGCFPLIRLENEIAYNHPEIFQ